MGAKKISKKKVVPAKKAAAKKPVTAKKAAARRPVPAKRAAAKKAAARRPAKHRHPVVHWEIQSLDPGRLHRFYADALGWVIDTNNPMGYGMVASGGTEGINGGIGGTEGESARVLVYAAVPDIDEALARIAAHGGKTVMPRQDIGMVVMALYQDPEGNLMGLVED
jgi:predicted enzyme related to lactoylglutathione lyase